MLNACNLKCAYCLCPEIKTKVLTTEQWCDIIGGLTALGTMRIKFQGGEPTLRPDFHELCRESQANGMVTAAITNGIATASQPALLDHLDELIVSLDAPVSERGDRQRGPGSHDAAVRTIDCAQQRGIRTFVNMVLTRETVPYLERMLEFCEQRGVLLNAQPVMFGSDWFDDRARDMALTPEQRRTSHQQMVDWKRQGRGLMFAASVYQKVADWPDTDNLLTVRSQGESACMAGKFYIHTEANGDVRPCVQHGGSLQPKNIIKDGLADAIRHVQRHDCGDCFTAYLNERKNLFDLRPGVLLEMIGRG